MCCVSGWQNRRRTNKQGIIKVFLASSQRFGARQIRQPLYVLLSDGSIQNRYEIKFNNKTEHPQRIAISITGIEAIMEAGGLDELELKPGQRLTLPIKVIAKPVQKKRKQIPIRFVAEFKSQSGEARSAVYDSHFSIPVLK